ncbi:hypothetical protein ACFVYJ_07350 [Pontibacter sp. JAM-7]|uniref:hypothetical protein n=1 Tax=Pontibacter sp. JAM-7 TaxID=3366581 RepID=UPI003AF537FC
MTRLWMTFFVLFLTVPELAFAAKPPPKNPPAAAPEIHSIKVSYNDLEVLVAGANLNPDSATVTLGGAAADIHVDSTSELLILPFTTAVSAAVNTPGNYMLSLTTDGGSLNLSIFVPFGLVYLPPGDGPCPCEGDWDLYAGQAPPAGYAGETPYCMIDSADYVTVQFADTIGSIYWVLRTQWDGSTGFCEQYLDGPRRALINEDEYNACTSYLRTGYVDVYPGTGSDCLF